MVWGLPKGEEKGIHKAEDIRGVFGRKGEPYNDDKHGACWESQAKGNTIYI